MMRCKHFGTAPLAASFLAVSLLTAVTAWSQVGSATLGGLVQDTSGALVSGATVQLHNLRSGADRSARTNGSGSFSFSGIPSGDYSVMVSRTGFQSVTENHIHLNPGDNRSLQDIRLNLGEASETVTVQTEMTGIPLDNGQLSATITAQDLENLSVVGRDATELQRILPGFAIRSLGSTNAAPDFSQVSIGQPTPYASNGAPVAGITLKLDGANLTDPGNFGANLQNINDSFVSEVHVQTSNFGVDQSNGPVVITGVTKSGTAQYHGSLYAFARTSQLNSNDSLAKFDGFARPNDRYVYPGGTFSGPVPGVKHLTFFAGAEYDAQRNVYAYNSVSSAILQALVPTAAMRKGDFSTAALQNYLGPQYGSGTYADIAVQPTVGDNGATLTNGNIGASLDPGAMALINGTLPLPNMATNAQGFNFQQLNLVNNNITQITGRTDYSPSESNQIFVRYSFEKGKQGQPQIPYYSPTVSSVLGAVNTPGYGVLNNIHVHSGAANWVSVLSPTATNELYATLTYFHQTFDARVPGAQQSSAISYPYNGAFDNGSKQFPQLGTYAAVGGLPLGLWLDNSFGAPFLTKFIPNAGDNVTKAWGTHTVRVGVFGQRDTNNQTITNGQTNGAIQNYFFGAAGTPFHGYKGTYPDGSPAFDPTTHFNSGNWLADFFEGHIQDWHQQNMLPRTNVYFWNVSGYAQDTWRATPRLVLNYGVRIDYLQAWTDAWGVGAAVMDASTIHNAQTAANSYPGFTWRGINSSIANSGTGSPKPFFEPRGGFAFDVFGTGKTVIRGGVGMYRFHDSEADVDAAFQPGRGVRTADLQGFGGNTLSGISSLHLNPATFGNAGGTETSIPPSTVTALDPTDHTAPLTTNYSLSIAQQLPKNAILQISYVGNNSNSLMDNGTTQAVTLDNINAIPVGTLYLASTAAKENAIAPGTCNPTGCTPQQVGQLSALTNYAGQASVQAVRPFPNYGTIAIPRHNTFANYNALQVVLQRYSGHFNYALNYTFSKALGILGSAADFNFTAPVDPFNLYNNYGPMNFDRTHALNATYSYQTGRIVSGSRLGGLVNGWLISGITNLQSGGNMQTGVSFSPSFYLQGTVNQGANAINVSNQVILGTPDVSLQPVLKCDPRSGLGSHQYINGGCFALPQFGQNGQFIFPYAQGPTFFNTDLTLEKGFGLGAERSLRFRIAAFNVLNHPLHSFGTGAAETTLVLSDPSSTGTLSSASYNPSSGFGFASRTVGRRLTEVSMRYTF